MTDVPWHVDVREPRPTPSAQVQILRDDAEVLLAAVEYWLRWPAVAPEALFGSGRCRAEEVVRRLQKALR